MKTFSAAKNISVSINRSATEVYKYASNPENLTKWASGLANSTVTRSGDHWVMSSPMGKVKVKFAPENTYGVLDHDVTVPSGEVFHNPLRVVKNKDGSEIIFTVFRRPEMTEPEFAKDAQTIEKDLTQLKSLLENQK